MFRTTDEKCLDLVLNAIGCDHAWLKFFVIVVVAYRHSYIGSVNSD